MTDFTFTEKGGTSSGLKNGKAPQHTNHKDAQHSAHRKDMHEESPVKAVNTKDNAKPYTNQKAFWSKKPSSAHTNGSSPLALDSPTARKPERPSVPYKKGLAREWIRQGLGKEKNSKQFRGMSQSTQSLIHTLSFLSEVGRLKGKALFVGDKPEHGLLFHEYLAGSHHSYLSCGWVPGLLTNGAQHEGTQQAHQILARILKEKPRALRGRAAKIFESREHIYAHMHNLKPDVIIFLGEEDYRSGALQECHKLQIPTVALCKTPSWSSRVTYPVFFHTSIQIVHKLTKLFRNALSGEFI